MKDFCILSDFDGTITEKDGLYTFISLYADDGWQKIEQDWANGKISSKECLIEEFKLVSNLSEILIDNFIKTLNIDPFFKEFYNQLSDENIDFFIVSDGIDYFIDRILAKFGIKNVNIISNHAEFKNGNFVITFPNDSNNCINNAGTCKCEILKSLRNKYKKIIYIGDGVSDFCVADKADLLWAKAKLKNYCQKNNIPFSPFETFKDIKF